MKTLTVYYHGAASNRIELGLLTLHGIKIYFEYSEEALQTGFELSPFQLPLKPGPIAPAFEPFNGLHGLFNDSLPDGWGVYLMDKLFRSRAINQSDITPLDRLTFIGDRSMGALSYEPEEASDFIESENYQLDIDLIADSSVSLYTGELNQVIKHIADVGIPPGGAKPKALFAIKDNQAIAGTLSVPDGYEHWLIKFPSGKTPDKRCEGAIEYLYSIMAKNSGIDFPETQLLKGSEHNNYFMIKRFDRIGNNHRQHIHTLAGLLGLNFRIASIGYDGLLKTCLHLTQSHHEVLELFRRMIFNIMSGNRDDHSKNFSFIMSNDGEWKNSPAYDVIFNSGINGEHTMDLHGKGKGITFSDILKIGKLFSIDDKKTKSIIADIDQSLSFWEKEFPHYGIPKQQATEITDYIRLQRKLLLPARSTTTGVVDMSCVKKSTNTP